MAITNERYRFINHYFCGISMVEAELLNVAVVISAIVGSGLNTLRGYLHHNEEGYSIRKLVGALIISTFGAIAIGQSIGVEGLGLVGTVLVGLTSGFALDYAITKAKKD